MIPPDPHDPDFAPSPSSIPGRAPYLAAGFPLPRRPAPDAADINGRLEALTGFLTHFARPAAMTEGCIHYFVLPDVIHHAWSEAVIACLVAVAAIALQTPAEFGIKS
jgi:hypothetical protein